MANFNIPDEDHWKAPVTAVIDLPTSYNETGDVRLVISTGELYYWDGSAWGLASSAGGGGGGNSYWPTGW